ncbi:MAG: hypothetical protein ACE5NP_04715 [Anaerolineae bacterium]
MTSDQPDAVATAPEPIQLPLPFAREAPRTSQDKRAIEAHFPIPKMAGQ